MISRGGERERGEKSAGFFPAPFVPPSYSGQGNLRGAITEKRSLLGLDFCEKCDNNESLTRPFLIPRMPALPSTRGGGLSPPLLFFSEILCPGGVILLAKPPIAATIAPFGARTLRTRDSLLVRRAL